jgi:hypothetical protein
VDEADSSDEELSFAAEVAAGDDPCGEPEREQNE